MLRPFGLTLYCIVCNQFAIHQRIFQLSYLSEKVDDFIDIKKDITEIPSLIINFQEVIVAKVSKSSVREAEYKI